MKHMYIAEPERRESVVALMSDDGHKTVAFLALNNATAEVTIQLESDGQVVTLPLVEFETGLQHAKQLLGLSV